MVLTRHEYIRGLAKGRSPRVVRHRSRAEWKRQDDGSDEDIDGEDPLAKGKGKENGGKGKGKSSEEPPAPTAPGVAQPGNPAPPEGPQAPPNPAPPAIALPPSTPALSIQPSPPPPNASVQPPALPVSSPPPPPPTETPSTPPRPPPPPPSASTTTSTVVSTSISIDSSTSVRTSFVTITQSTVMRQETVVTTATPTSVDAFPSLLEPTTSEALSFTPSSSSSTQPATTETIIPLPPVGDTEPATRTDPAISPLARNLLIALGAVGGLSLLITGLIILLKRSRKRPFYRINSGPTSRDHPFAGQPVSPYGVTTEITAVPRRASFQHRTNALGARTQNRTVARVDEEAATGAVSENNKRSAYQRAEERTFSDALDSFMVSHERDSRRTSLDSSKVGK